MAYVFLDESGDLGFDFRKKRTSRYFVVTLLFVSKKGPIEKIVRSVHHNLRKKFRIKSGVLHATDVGVTNRLRFCRKLASKDVTIVVAYLDKHKAYSRNKDERHVLYNQIVNILLERLITQRIVTLAAPLELITARRETSSSLNMNLKRDVILQLKKKHNLDLHMQIRMPHEEKGLQAVDMASWAIFRKYELQDAKYFDLLRPIIAEEKGLFQ